MDGGGQTIDNIYFGSLWRAVKNEDIYIKTYETGVDLMEGMECYFAICNHEQPH